jgi:hypothetical protein
MRIRRLPTNQERAQQVKIIISFFYSPAAAQSSAHALSPSTSLLLLEAASAALRPSSDKRIWAEMKASCSAELTYASSAAIFLFCCGYFDSLQVPSAWADNSAHNILNSFFYVNWFGQ